jgi:hypothetical protein
MFEIPANFDFSFLIGRTLLQLGIGNNEIILNLDEEIQILCEAPIVLKRPNMPSLICKLQGADCIGLPSVIGKKIVECSRADAKTLNIKFEGEAVIELKNDNQNESYSVIRRKNSVLTV